MANMRVAVIMNVIPHYRESFYRELFERPELEVTVYCQQSIPRMNLATVAEKFPENVRIVRATTLARELFGWQYLPWRILLREYDVLFVYANPRVLSNLLFASVARLLGHAVVLWGPAHSSGADGIAAKVRLAWWRYFKGLFVYTDREAAWLRKQGFSRQYIVGMNNGLNQRKIDSVAQHWGSERLRSWQMENGLHGHRVILSCARLEPKNDFALWIDAMPAVLQRFPDTLWCVVGEGRESERLLLKASAIGVDHAIRWLGVILDEEALAPWFLSSQLLVHPAAIGLTLLHAFGYGLPVVTNDDAGGQMPEFAAFTADVTGSTYLRGDAGGLAGAACELLADPARRAAMAVNARRVARDQYNAAIMVDRFVAMATHMGTQGVRCR